MGFQPAIAEILSLDGYVKNYRDGRVERHVGDGLTEAFACCALFILGIHAYYARAYTPKFVQVAVTRHR